jgi:hemolysin-activating ACP:hemolysin acyltransferase
VAFRDSAVLEVVLLDPAYPTPAQQQEEDWAEGEHLFLVKMTASKPSRREVISELLDKSIPAVLAIGSRSTTDEVEK